MALQHVLHTPKMFCLPQCLWNGRARPLALVGEDGGGWLVQEARHRRELQRVIDQVAVRVAGVLRGDTRCKTDDIVVGGLGADRPHHPVKISLQIREIHGGNLILLKDVSRRVGHQARPGQGRIEATRMG